MSKCTQISMSILVALLVLLPYSFNLPTSRLIGNIALGAIGVLYYHMGLKPFDCKKDFSVTLGSAVAITLVSFNFEHIFI